MTRRVISTREQGRRCRTIGHVADAEIDAVKAIGFDDEAIIEITGVVFIDVLTNAVKHIAETVPDYPVVCAR